jgi:hypothetical protein
MKKHPRSDQLESPSYLELRLDLSGKQGAIFLRVPTYWDAPRKCWLGALKMDDGEILHADGKDSFELQNNFNILVSKRFETHSDQMFAMFKPLEYWEDE